MKVFKFGGVSLQNAASIKNVASIISSHLEESLLVVASAMGKTTNALEHLLAQAMRGERFDNDLDQVMNYHQSVAAELFDPKHLIFFELEEFRKQLIKGLSSKGDPDMVYDQVVCVGELMSTKILSAYLNAKEVTCHWIDSREYIITDSCFKEGKVNWEQTAEKIHPLVPWNGVILAQGFIASNGDLSTTLGREGSDFSAAIFASCLNAESVTIWKDVPGVMTADPKRIKGAITFEELPFREAAEMTYYGASVIHPKTIKPLANKGIPLYVKNFDDPQIEGTLIHECKVEKIPPLIVFKDNQCLISCHVTDYTFISEPQIEIIFNALSSNSLRINMMQNSAISFSFCLDFNERKVLHLIEQLSQHFEVYYNTGLTLVTVKNFNQKLFDKYRNHSGVILEQSSRSTLQVLFKP